MAEKTYYNFTTPIGRLVSGSPSYYRTTNQLGEPIIYKSGIHKGEPKKEYSMGVAFKKTQADVPAFIRELRGYAAQEWPRLFDEDLNCQFDDFAGKITDGDSTKMNKKQRRPCDNPDWQGCWIVWFTSDREPQCVTRGAGKIMPASEIKTGYYVRVKGSTCKNAGDTPGMYMNLEGVELSGYGPEIETRPDPREAFRAKQAAVVPEGMSDVPVPKGEVSVPGEAPPPPIPPGEKEKSTGSKVLYQGVTYERDQLIRRGWTEAQVAALPTA
jgi:hypothetical protein